MGGPTRLLRPLLLASLLLASSAQVTTASDIANPAARAKSSAEYSPQTAWDLGYSGKGVTICIMDTGVDNGHPSLAGKWLGGADMSKPETLLTPRDGTYDADDTHGHGTTCAGIAMGTGAPEGRYQGTAPGARLVDLRIGTVVGYAPGEGPLNLYDASLKGIQWALEHRDQTWPSGGEDYRGINILSLSWGIDVGGSSDGSDPYSAGVDRLVEAGIFVVHAAGNDGPDNIGFSGMSAASNGICVAATDDRDTIDRQDDIIAEYSSRGPRRDNGDNDPYNELRPDVAAPGTGITQAEFDRLGDGSGNGYGPRGSGTSYATPLVAGIVALMLEANGNLTPAVAREILRATAERRGEPSAPELDPFWSREYGWGIVDAWAAVRMAERTVDVGAVDTGLQCFVTNVTVHGSAVRVRGLAWNRYGELDGAEARLDEGRWRPLSPGGGPFGNWSLEIGGLSAGSHSIQVRALADGKSSLVQETRFNFSAEQTPRPAAAAGVAALIGGIAAAASAIVAYRVVSSRARRGGPPG
ncbi:MAG: S8 family serine peptidase [Thermoplasmatota archaeon]